MLELQMYVPPHARQAVRACLTSHRGVGHVVEVGSTADGDLVLLTAAVEPSDVDALLPELVAAGVAGDEISVLHQNSNRPMGTSRGSDQPAWSGGAVAWTELAMESRQYARAVPLYLILMACAGVIAAFGIMTRSEILVVGAMAISPDLLPLCATCVAIVGRRVRLARRAFIVLVLGMVVAALAAYVVTALLRVGGYGPANGDLGDGGLGVLPTVNIATVLVALVAGVAGMLSFETRSSSAVGVAISVTTIPAASFIGAAVAVHDGSGAGGAFAVLVVNIVMLLVAGTTTLLAQRLRHRGSRPE
jgi:uncharacterized hydrophobic protein (TIGR00271 family)